MISGFYFWPAQAKPDGGVHLAPAALSLSGTQQPSKEDDMATFQMGRANVHYLHAPYDEVVKTLGNDGTVSPRDDYKSMCEWDVKTPHGTVEVYDYKVGVCYDEADGLQREDITEWHVQGSVEAINHLIRMFEGS